MKRGDRISVSGDGGTEVLEGLASELGPLVPVSVCALLAGISANAVRDRLRRRTVTAVVVWGATLVPVREVCPCELGKVTTARGSATQGERRSWKP